MKTVLFPAAAIGCATLMGLSAHALPVSTFDVGGSIQMAGSSDGAGLPGLPGGRGGKSGRELARELNRNPSRYSGADDDDTDPRLADYCIALLKSDGRSRGSGDLRPSDCAEYFMALDSAQGGGRSGQAGRSGSGDTGRRGGDGADGPSIAGGQGGQGGKVGGGPGGGRGGGGGAGVGGGVGGKGGAGGGGY